MNPLKFRILLSCFLAFSYSSCFLTGEDPMYALGIENNSGLVLEIYVTTDKDTKPYEFVETIPIDFNGQITNRSFDYNQLYWAEARTEDGNVYAINTWFVDGSDIDVHWWDIN